MAASSGTSLNEGESPANHQHLVTTVADDPTVGAKKPHQQGVLVGFFVSRGGLLGQCLDFQEFPPKFEGFSVKCLNVGSHGFGVLKPKVFQEVSKVFRFECHLLKCDYR